MLHYKTQILLLSLSEISNNPQDTLLAKLGVGMMVTRNGPPGPPSTQPLPLTTEVPVYDPGTSNPAASRKAGGSEEGEVNNSAPPPGHKGEKDKNPQSSPLVCNTYAGFYAEAGGLDLWPLQDVQRHDGSGSGGKSGDEQKIY